MDVRLGRACHPPPAGTWVGFELRRDLEVTERFTLGGPRAAVLWDRAAVRCCSARPGVRIILFGVENAADLKRADRLGVYGRS